MGVLLFEIKYFHLGGWSMSVLVLSCHGCDLAPDCMQSGLCDRTLENLQKNVERIK